MSLDGGAGAPEEEPEQEVERGLVPGGCADFVNDRRSPFKSLVGGMGSGKTDAAAANALITGSINAPLPFLFVEPTYDLIRTVALPMFRKVLEKLEVTSTWHERDKMLIVGEGDAQFPVMMRSGEDPERIIGFEAGAGCIDEAARQKRAVWKAVNQRCRAPGTKLKQVSMCSTPEGHNWFYEVVQHSPPVGMKLYRARTADNPFMLPSYLRDLRATMTDAEFLAYAEGQFVNLTTGLVYTSWDRAKHARVCTNPDAGQLFVGCDFNISKMVWEIGRNLGDEIHFFDEIVGINKNTYAMAESLLRWAVAFRRRTVPVETADSRQRWIRESIRVHVDASGDSRKTSASESDMAILRRYGFSVYADDANPRVVDRVYTLEQLLRPGKVGRYRFFVDADRCKELVRSLEGQGWAGNPPEPAKGKGVDDLSGAVDAAGYGVWGFYDLRSTRPEGNARPIEQYG